jgi:hypothetical protein
MSVVGLFSDSLAAATAPNGRSVALWVFLGLLGSFAVIRTCARLMRSPKAVWWLGSVKTANGVHVHHLVWGIITVLITGFLGFTLGNSTPTTEILGALFGIGAGLTLDEFALWLRLQDVYWTEEGQQSIDAVILAVLIAGLVVAGIGPVFGGSAVEVALIGTVQLLCTGVAVVKGKVIFGLVGLFIIPLGALAAIRLGKPGSPWARWRYHSRPQKQARALTRARSWHQRRIWFHRLIAGIPGR